MVKLWGHIKSVLKRFFPLTIRRFNQEASVLHKADERQLEAMETTHAELDGIQKALTRLERDSSERNGLVTQLSTLQDQLERLAPSIEKLKSIESVIHRRSDRLEKCMIHCIPRAELSFEVALVEHCNMNCAGCDHFSPLAEPEFAAFEETARDFARLSELFHRHAKEIHLLGGEPLLNPNLSAYFKMARGYFPDAIIDVTTNGLLLLAQPEDFWLSCRDNNIVIRPTKYPVPLDFEKMEKRAAKFGVQYRYFGNTGTTVKTSNHYRLDTEGRQDGSRNFLLCHRANTCVYLQQGRLYTCTIAPTIRHFNKYFGTEMKVMPEDSINIYQAGSAQEIMDFLARPIPFCRYCMVDKTRWNRPWHQSEKAIEEWT